MKVNLPNVSIRACKPFAALSPLSFLFAANLPMACPRLILEELPEPPRILSMLQIGKSESEKLS